MNALQLLQAKAGQIRQENFFGADMDIFGINIPCTHTHIMNDFDFGPAGESATTVVESIIFRRELCVDDAGNVLSPVKGVQFSLNPGNGAPSVALQLWQGGILPDGLNYQFMAVDADYRA